MHLFLKKLIMMGNGHRRTQLLVEDMFASCNHYGKKKVFRISTRAINTKDENCEKNLFLYQEVMIQYLWASKNLWMPG